MQAIHHLLSSDFARCRTNKLLAFRRVCFYWSTKHLFGRGLNGGLNLFDWQLIKRLPSPVFPLF
ncbi:hypothetical protein MNBD_ALPHA12-989 [hydrothermal vent metagenome]|uniref:Uncharacterized protein n=1 Tax=hydrothermal vent metagenome TaxID=652676 RepID=A0A3B0U952_9ZZZZ